MEEYKILLKKAYSQIQINENKKININPPVISRISSKKVLWENFAKICSQLNRKIDHFLTFAKTELNSDCSLDENKALIIRGIYKPQQIQNIIRSYISIFVICKSCNCCQTEFAKNTITCNNCKSSRYVPPIQIGFKAITRKGRKDIRNNS